MSHPIRGLKKQIFQAAAGIRLVALASTISPTSVAATCMVAAVMSFGNLIRQLIYGHEKPTCLFRICNLQWHSAAMGKDILPAGGVVIALDIPHRPLMNITPFQIAGNQR